MSYPKRVLIAVTCHGTIIINNKETNEPELFTLPQNMKVIKLSAVTPGVCNLTIDDDIDEFIETILDKKSEKKINKELKKPETYTKKLADLYQTIEEETVNGIFNTTTSNSNKSLRKDYIHHRNKSYKIITYDKKHPNMINKEYTRNKKTEQNSSKWDYGIYCLNVEGKPDLFTKLKGRSYKDENVSINLEEIVSYLHQKGVKEIVILDMSCSNFEYKNDDKTVISDRNARSIRSNILKQNLNGGKVSPKKRTIKKRYLFGRRKTKNIKLHKNNKSTVTRKRKPLKNIRGGSEEEQKRKDNMNKILEIISKTYQNKDDRNAAYKRVMGFSTTTFNDIINEIDKGNPDILINYLQMDGFVPGNMNTNASEQEKKREYIMKIMQLLNENPENKEQINELTNWFNMFSLEHLRDLIDKTEKDPNFLTNLLGIRNRLNYKPNPIPISNTRETRKPIIQGNIIDGKLNGKGQIIFPNGVIYNGEFKDDKLNGQGVVRVPDGGHFEGNFKDNLLNGKGKIITEDNIEISGYFIAGKLDGQGKIQFPNGAVHKGEFKNDKLNGKGKIIESGGIILKGMFSNNQLNGIGDITFPNGVKQIGEFKEGLLNGEGDIINSNGDILEGTFQNGDLIKSNGITFKNGNIYEGGVHLYIEKNDNDDDSRNFVFLRDGIGKTTYQNGSIYEGNYKEGKRDGKGIYVDQDGTIIYQGEWQNGKRHGQGTYKDQEGNVYQGEWQNGKRHGQGTYKDPQGNVYQGEWQNGKFIR